MTTHTIKGVPVAVNAAGQILVDPAKLSSVLDSGNNPNELTDADRRSDALADANGLTRFPHSFARRMAEIARG